MIRACACDIERTVNNKSPLPELLDQTLKLQRAGVLAP
jgi:hypothetical protein